MFHRRDLPSVIAGIVLALAALGPAALAEDDCSLAFTEGPDEVGVIPFGEVCYGLGGDDIVYQVDGTFHGGPGDEQVDYVVGTFYGGPGDDHVGSTYASSKQACTAMVDGGPGDDTVWLNCGMFYGGPGHDIVGTNERHWYQSDTLFTDAVFYGEVGDDSVKVINEYNAQFWGGKGDDCVAQNLGMIDSARLGCPG